MKTTTAQILFDESVLHMAAQKKISISRLGRCQYKASNGSRCAVGCLFRRGEYKKVMEGKCVHQLMSKDLLPERLKPYSELLDKLQIAHDFSHSVETLTSDLAKIAMQFELDGRSVLEFTEWRGLSGQITRVKFK